MRLVMNKELAPKKKKKKTKEQLTSSFNNSTGSLARLYGMRLRAHLFCLFRFECTKKHFCRREKKKKKKKKKKISKKPKGTNVSVKSRRRKLTSSTVGTTTNLSNFAPFVPRIGCSEGSAKQIYCAVRLDEGQRTARIFQRRSDQLK
jgi:hypothetical protein